MASEESAKRYECLFLMATVEGISNYCYVENVSTLPSTIENATTRRNRAGVAGDRTFLA